MKIYKIEAGTFYADGGAMFGVVPKKVWQKRYPCNEENMCQLAMRCLVIKTDERLIVVDTGTGAKQLDYLKYYNFSGIVDFETELNKLGYTTSDVTDVVLTHLHFDHCGTCTVYNEDKSEIIPTFKNATYWVGKEQWENFLNPNVREGDSYFKENMLPVVENNQLRLIEEDMWLDKDVELRLYDGHTVGQIVVYAHTKEKTLVYAGDVIPLVASVRIAWISSYDTHPIISMKEKRRMLKEAEEKGQVIVFDHDVYTECCTIKKVNNVFRVDKTFTIDEFKEQFKS